MNPTVLGDRPVVMEFDHVARPGPSREERRSHRMRLHCAGLAAASRAVRAVDPAAPPVRGHPGRPPVWPAGVTGSVAHAPTLVVAAAARHVGVARLGVDVEEEAVLPPEVLASVLGQSEQRWVRRRPELGVVLFSAKEAAWKAWQSGWLPLRALSVELVEVASGYGRFRVGSPWCADALDGVWSVRARHVVTVVIHR